MFEYALARPLLRTVLEARRREAQSVPDNRLLLAQTDNLRRVQNLWRTLEGRHHSNLQRLEALGPAISSQYTIYGDNSIMQPPRTLTNGELYDTLREIQYTADLGLLAHRVFTTLCTGPHYAAVFKELGMAAILDEQTRIRDFEERRKIMNICRPFMDKGLQGQIRAFRLHDLEIVVYSARPGDHNPVRDRDRLAHQFWHLYPNSADTQEYGPLLELDLTLVRRGPGLEAAQRHLRRMGLQVNIQVNIQPAVQPPAPLQAQQGLNGNDILPAIDINAMDFMAPPPAIDDTPAPEVGMMLGDVQLLQPQNDFAPEFDVDAFNRFLAELGPADLAFYNLDQSQLTLATAAEEEVLPPLVLQDAPTRTFEDEVFPKFVDWDAVA
ncbi:MAG: hypothetical protein M1836_001746 [Candelina mexicana]|nr:MAG: hypothetical protein M1836_001746 [Candelina mexicana]